MPFKAFRFKYPRQSKKKSEVSPSPEVAMARQYRLENGLTHHQMREALGIKYNSQYQRLEDPNKSNPQLKNLFKVKTIFPDFPTDLIFT